VLLLLLMMMMMWRPLLLTPLRRAAFAVLPAGHI
jgi:hypothetical protein